MDFWDELDGYLRKVALLEKKVFCFEYEARNEANVNISFIQE